MFEKAKTVNELKQGWIMLEGIKLTTPDFSTNASLR